MRLYYYRLNMLLYLLLFNHVSYECRVVGRQLGHVSHWYFKLNHSYDSDNPIHKSHANLV